MPITIAENWAGVLYSQFQAGQYAQVLTGGQYHGAYVFKSALGLSNLSDGSDAIDSVRDSLSYRILSAESITITLP